MLDPTFYRDYKVIPTPWAHNSARYFYRGWLRATRTRLQVEGWEQVPSQPCLIATNSTQKQDFMALRACADLRGTPCVTVTKAKNYHHPLMAFALKRLGVVPLASKGYFILADAVATLGRRPTDAEYRALRDHIDKDGPMPAEFAALQRGPRLVVGHKFDPGVESWRGAVRRIYRESLQQTVRLAKTAVDAGSHVQMYPEGTVSTTLGVGRIGAVQLAIALGIPILPVGMSGCPEAFFGDSPMVRGGTITLRVGKLLHVPRDLVAASFEPFDPTHEAANRPALQGFTDMLMDQLETLVDPPYRRAPGGPGPGKGTRAFL